MSPSISPRRDDGVARQALLRMASQRLSSPVAELTIADGIVRSKSNGKQVGYSELVGTQRLSLPVDKNAPLKAPGHYAIAGKSVARIDILSKVTGQFTYAQDFKVPGMLHGRPVHPPAIKAKLLSIDESSVGGIPGIVKIVRQGDFCEVVAETEWAAIKAARVLKATWSTGIAQAARANAFDVR